MVVSGCLLFSIRLTIRLKALDEAHEKMRGEWRAIRMPGCPAPCWALGVRPLDYGCFTAAGAALPDRAAEEVLAMGDEPEMFDELSSLLQHDLVAEATGST